MHGSQQERRDVATFMIDGVNANIWRLEQFTDNCDICSVDSSVQRAVAAVGRNVH